MFQTYHVPYCHSLSKISDVVAIEVVVVDLMIYVVVAEAGVAAVVAVACFSS